MALSLTVVALFFSSTVAQELGSNSSTPARQGWQTGTDTRSSFDILWPCLSAIFACTWTVLHLNTPGIEEVDGYVLLRNIAYFVITILAPEVICTIALVQWAEARRISLAFSKLASSLSNQASETQQTASADVPLLSEGANTAAKVLCEMPWTMAHSFLVATGGLIVQAGRDDGSTGDYSALREDDILKLATSEGAIFPSLDAKVIGDKSKADNFAKLSAVTQSTWVLISVLGRAGQRLPVTPLEFMTLGFIACALLIYLLWWSKPKNVMVPLVIRLHKGKQVRDYVATKQKRRSTGGDPDPAAHFPIVTGLIAVVLGAIHIAAWDFDFASTGERVAWRVCAVASTGVPFVFVVHEAWTVLFGFGNTAPLDSSTETSPGLLGAGLVVIFLLLLAAYVMSRVGLAVLSFMAMRSLPTGCYEKINWVEALPHF